MKIRKGFVSNSSSSSFLVGVAQLENVNKFKMWCIKNNIPFDHYAGVHIVSFDNLQRTIEDCNLFKIDWVESGESIKLSKNYLKKIDPAAWFVYFEIINHDEDDQFRNHWDLDYEYDRVHEDDFFSEEQQCLLKAFNGTCKEAGIVHGMSSYGAGRNG